MPVKAPKPGELEAIERASRDELQALQLQRLQATLQHAYEHVPHYRRAFDAQGVHPSDCKSLADLAKFPFTNKGDLLTAVATEVAKSGRTGVYDIAVSNQRGERVAAFRGRSYTMKGRPVVEGLPIGKQRGS